MFYIYSFQLVFLKKIFLKVSHNLQENNCSGFSALNAASNFINDEATAKCFPKLLTIFIKTFIVDVRLGSKHYSVLPPW